jgi:hypothetical protein
VVLYVDYVTITIKTEKSILLKIGLNRGVDLTRAVTGDSEARLIKLLDAVLGRQNYEKYQL